MVYVKPVVPIALIVLYLRFIKKPDFLFPLSMLVITIINVFIYLDFEKYYTFIAILTAIFYVLCVLLLKKFITKRDIKLRLLLTPQVLLSILLIGYLIYSLIELVLPKISSSLKEVTLVTITLLLFVTVCFFIYSANRFEKSIYLFIAACCTLFVDGLLTINELYYYNKVFTVLINITEVVGLYFLTIFFIETKPLDEKYVSDKYF